MASKKDTPKDTPVKFEDALAHVERIIDELESGQVGLEDALKQYEVGVGLINACRAQLGKAQAQLEDLSKRLDSADEQG
jgi:exodeoxyribonuclease VII small subunit